MEKEPVKNKIKVKDEKKDEEIKKEPDLKKKIEEEKAKKLAEEKKLKEDEEKKKKEDEAKKKKDELLAKKREEEVKKEDFKDLPSQRDLEIKQASEPKEDKQKVSFAQDVNLEEKISEDATEKEDKSSRLKLAQKSSFELLDEIHPEGKSLPELLNDLKKVEDFLGAEVEIDVFEREPKHEEFGRPEDKIKEPKEIIEEKDIMKITEKDEEIIPEKAGEIIPENVEIESSTEVPIDEAGGRTKTEEIIGR
ncbi:unnamed protein product [Meloidogyne enterolobii]|uniref:Uncharacterized protein n=1 Tax=Meloidogyne enterolobii TaxID=390850 RepID=A0ACB1AYJ7_MELEN